MRTGIFFILGFLFSSLQCFALNQYDRVEEGHVHEAFMNTESTVTLLTAVPLEPPPPLKETVSEQIDPQAIWVKGYWEWSYPRSEFVWCSGCWRLPPPDHQWIPGYWVKMQDGWVRVRGFWSDVPESKLAYINQTPPDPYNENPKNSPGKDFFWMSGYWKYEHNKYEWYEGKWEVLDENWVYVPPRYVWLPEGYVFVPAFWDFPLDERGIAYACIAVPHDRREIEYLPELIIEPGALIEGCLLFYPDYTYFYFYYCHYHPSWWESCTWCPPWWGWDWWWMPWADHWGIWWWWCHPGFPAPVWLESWTMGDFFGPPLPLMQAMEGAHPPPIIGPKGLIPPVRLIDKAGGKPILPQNPKKIQNEASRGLKEGKVERPRGTYKPLDELRKDAPKMPQTTPKPPAKAPVGKTPSLPKQPSRKPPIRKPEKRPPSRKPPTIETPQKPEVQQPDRPQKVPGERPGRPQWPDRDDHGQRPQFPGKRPGKDLVPEYTPQTPQRTPQTPQITPQIPQQRPQTPQIPQARPQKPSVQPKTPQQITPQQNVNPSKPSRKPNQDLD
jgi:hypothetical protein